VCVGGLVGKTGSVSAGDKSYDVTSDMVEIKRVKKKLAGRNFVPSVIEPSFGIGRILYCVFEHSYYTREVRVAHCRRLEDASVRLVFVCVSSSELKAVFAFGCVVHVL